MFCMDFSKASFRDITGEITQRSILHGKHVVAITLEHSIVHLQYVLVRVELGRAVVLPAELVSCHQVAVDCLQDNLVPGVAMLSKINTREPAFSYQLHQVILGMDIDLGRYSENSELLFCNYWILLQIEL